MLLHYVTSKGGIVSFTGDGPRLSSASVFGVLLHDGVAQGETWP